MSTPEAGEIWIIESGMFRNRHVIVRIDSVAKTMANVSEYRRLFGEEGGGFGFAPPVRRKIQGFVGVLPEGADIHETHVELLRLHERLFSDERKLSETYRADVATHIVPKPTRKP